MCQCQPPQASGSAPQAHSVGPGQGMPRSRSASNSTSSTRPSSSIGSSTTGSSINKEAGGGGSGSSKARQGRGGGPDNPGVWALAAGSGRSAGPAESSRRREGPQEQLPLPPFLSSESRSAFRSGLVQRGQQPSSREASQGPDRAERGPWRGSPHIRGDALERVWRRGVEGKRGEEEEEDEGEATRGAGGRAGTQREQREEREREPSRAERTLPPELLKRLRRELAQARCTVKVGRVGISPGVVKQIHDLWRHHETVRVRCQHGAAANMRRTHHELEVSPPASPSILRLRLPQDSPSVEASGLHGHASSKGGGPNRGAWLEVLIIRRSRGPARNRQSGMHANAKVLRSSSLFCILPLVLSPPSQPSRGTDLPLLPGRVWNVRRE